MLRIYIDWNVLTYLKNPQREPYISMLSKIEQYKDYLLIPYSPAHISDLLKGWDGSTEKDEITRIDLKLISQITNNHFIVQYWNRKNISVDIKDPEKYFDETKDEEKEPWAERLDFLKLFEQDDMTEEMKVMVDKLKSLKFEFDMPSSMPASEEAKFKFKSPAYKKGQSVLDFMQEFVVYMEQIMKNPELYGNLRSIVREGLNLDSNVSNWQNPYDKLDKYLPTTVLGKSFTEQINSGKPKHSQERNERHDNFVSAFSQLDLFGYHPDKLSPKNTHENLMNDAHHSFYAAHCDIYITNDKQSAAKSKALYGKYNIHTKIFKPQEFLAIIDSLITETNSAEELLSDWVANIKNSISNQWKLSPETASLFDAIVNLKKPVLNHFNTCLMQFPDDGNSLLTFIRIPVHYGDFLIYTELETIVNKMYRILGPDFDQLGLLEFAKNNEQLCDDKWPGRRWKFNGFSIGVFMVDKWFKVLLLISPNDSVESYRN